MFADRIVGKPYLEIHIDRERIARYGIHLQNVQDVIEVAIGGKQVTTTVEGRERYPVRVRYQRELRDDLESLGTILVPTPDGRQIPLGELAEGHLLPRVGQLHNQPHGLILRFRDSQHGSLPPSGFHRDGTPRRGPAGAVGGAVPDLNRIYLVLNLKTIPEVSIYF